MESPRPTSEFARLTILAVFLLLVGCDQNEEEAEVEIGLSSIEGLLAIQYDESSLVPVDDHLLEIEIDEKDSLCYESGVSCDSDFRTDSTGTFFFRDLLPGRYSLHAESGTISAEGSTARLLETTIALVVEQDESIEHDFLMGTYSKDVSISLSVTGQSPGLPIQYKIKPCSGCDSDYFCDGCSESTNVYWNSAPNDASIDGECALDHTIYLWIEVDDTVYFYDENCESPSGCCTMRNFEDASGPRVSDYWSIKVGDSAAEFTSSYYTHVQFKFEHELSSFDPFVVDLPIEVQWLRSLDTAPCD